MTNDQEDEILIKMKPEDMLPAWDSLTEEEQKRLQQTHPSLFGTPSKKSAKKAAEAKAELLGTTEISQEELDRPYQTNEEDPRSQATSLPSTEGNGRVLEKKEE